MPRRPHRPLPAPLHQWHEARAPPRPRPVARDGTSRSTPSRPSSPGRWPIPTARSPWRRTPAPCGQSRTGDGSRWTTPWSAPPTDRCTRERRPVGMTFSGGGSGPMAGLTAALGSRISFGWGAADLPAPVLDGPAATYAEVLPGVDLVLTADTDSFDLPRSSRTPRPPGRRCPREMQRRRTRSSGRAATRRFGSGVRPHRWPRVQLASPHDVGLEDGHPRELASLPEVHQRRSRGAAGRRGASTPDALGAEALNPRGDPGCSAPRRPCHGVPRADRPLLERGQDGLDLRRQEVPGCQLLQRGQGRQRRL